MSSLPFRSGGASLLCVLRPIAALGGAFFFPCYGVDLVSFPASTVDKWRRRGGREVGCGEGGGFRGGRRRGLQMRRGPQEGACWERRTKMVTRRVQQGRDGRWLDKGGEGRNGPHRGGGCTKGRQPPTQRTGGPTRLMGSNGGRSNIR